MSIQKRKNGTLVTVAGLPNIDQILSADSRNAVENRTIYNALRLKVERTVNDLANYYLKSETYTKEEVEALIATISTMTMKIVTALPETDISTTTIYLIKSGATSYDEYIYVDGVWAKIGSTEINLEDYYTKEEVNELLDNLVTDVIIDVSVLPTSEIQNIIYRIVNEYNETEYYAGDADNQTTEQLAKRSDVTRTWVGTQAEWDNLTAAEKAEFEIVCFTDDNGANGKDIYSTTETKTNKVWIDGKPIYRKVLVFNNPKWDWTPNTFNIPDISQVVTANFIAYPDTVNNPNFYWTENWTLIDSGKYLSATINSGRFLIKTNTIETTSDSKVIWTIEYTKND